MAEFDFLVLGPLELRAGSTAHRISGRRQRALFACLLLAHSRPLTTAELVASIYGADADSRAAHAVHELASSLRRTLAPLGLDALLQSTAEGYRFALDPSRLDSWRFEDLLAEAHQAGDPGVRGELLQGALRLWRGSALGNTELDGGARAEVQRLEELRRTALGDWIDLELAAGRHQSALAELERATRLDPYNERFRSQQMLALYRDGRQADALRVYQETRERLAEEMGLEPTERLRTLQHRILNHDPELLTAGASPRGRSRTARHRGLIVAIATVLAAIAGVAVATGAFNARQGSRAVFADSLKGPEIDTKFWDVETFGNGPTVAESSNGAFLTIPAHATPTDSTGVIKARMASYCTLAGLFDVQVDYNLSTWPSGNGAGIGIYAAWADLIRESTPNRELYVGAHRFLDPPDGAPHKLVSTRDLHGTLRIVRSADQMIELVRQGNAWHQLYAFPNPTPAAVSVYLELWTNTRRFSHRQVQVTLTKFRVNSGFLQCPSN